MVRYLGLVVAALIGGALIGLGARAASPVINQTVAIVDAADPFKQAGVDTSGNLKVIAAAGSATIGAVSSVQASATARGGSITTGGTSQTLMAANTSRKGFIVQNPCSATEQGIAAAENLYINLTSAATVSTNANLAVLPPCSSFSMGITAGVVSTELVTVIAATTGHIWLAKEF